MTGLPSEDLEAVSEAAWARLTRGAADKRTAFNKMQLATIGAQGWPELRTVVLRRVDAAQRRLLFHTDRRSAKAPEIEADGRVSLHLWDARARLQLRLWGQARLLTADPMVLEEWERLTPAQRETYGGALPPGRPLARPAEADPDESRRLTDDEAAAVFSIVPVTVMRFEWLHLRRGGHRRARFDLGSTGWEGRWLAP
ncbi:MAG: pyridoxamine 5'-phosphate oxidase family protein [Pseudomonadota bacterium]